ncbi:hypothetical protein ACWDTP_36485 [Mycobacterium sp. NPDC003449]
MTSHTIFLDAEVPAGWLGVNPVGDDAGNATAVFVRGADHYTAQAPAIIITKHLPSSSEIDLEEFARVYAERRRARTIGLEITRSGYITKDSPAQYGQEMQFVLVSGVVVKLTHMTIGMPTVEGKTQVLEVTFSAPEEQYASCGQEFAEFLKSLRVVTG